MSNLLAQNWWAIALRGVFAIAFGIVALFMPGAALLALVLLFAAYMPAPGNVRGGGQRTCPARVVLPGYAHHERLLRPAFVGVGKSSNAEG